MRSKQLKNKSAIFLSLIIGIFLLQSISIYSSIMIKGQDSVENLEGENLKNSNYWVITHKIQINDNWSETEAEFDWCSGLGTHQTKYRIENVTINE